MAIECIAFSKGHFDSHAAYSKTKDTYTIVATQSYVVFDSEGWRKLVGKSGDEIKQVSYVVGENCGVFYNHALNQIKKVNKIRK